jgi:hypothetical protein
MADTSENRIVKGGSRTYFFDVKQTQEGKSYLVITESHYRGEGQARERARLTIYPDQANEFVQAINEMVKDLK